MEAYERSARQARKLIMENNQNYTSSNQKEIIKEIQSIYDAQKEIHYRIQGLVDKGDECFSKGSDLLKNLHKCPERVFEAADLITDATTICSAIVEMIPNAANHLKLCEGFKKMLSQLFQLLNQMEELSPLIKFNMTRSDGKVIDLSAYKSED